MSTTSTQAKNKNVNSDNERKQTKLFNSLPKEIRNMKKFTEDEFKEKLDEYLQKLPDQPKIDGLIPWGQDLEGKPSNSILIQVARGPAKRSPGV